MTDQPATRAWKSDRRLPSGPTYTSPPLGCITWPATQDAFSDARKRTTSTTVALNPVRARLAKRAVGWRWSSVHDQLSRKRSRMLTDTAPVRERYAAL